MIKPHGSEELAPRIVADASRRREMSSDAKSLPALTVSSAAAANAVMLGAGYFSPLTGYHDYANALEIARHMRTMEGLLWPIPCLNLVNDAGGIAVGQRVALRDPNVAGEPVLAIQHVTAIEALSTFELEEIIGHVFGTLDTAHPGVFALRGQGSVLVSGPVEVLSYSYFQTDFPDTFRTAVEIREDFERRGWERVVAFQTRNPMHRAHEELCKLAQAAVDADGVLIHMLLGKLKPGDIPANVRDAAIRKMVELYFPDNSVTVAGYGFDMLYAGPREAILHAIFRQNAGCTHLIVGRDHAGVGDYYGPFEAQEVFKKAIPPDGLDIEIFEADHTAYSRKLDRVVMMRDAPDHSPDDFLLLSGTRVRDMLAAGEALPPEFARPEVADILMRYYRRVRA
jgi:sulfate adenylyltransferase